MKRSLRALGISVALLSFVASCGGGAGGMTPHAAVSPGSGEAFTVDGFAAHFTEYALPQGVVPFYDTVGPDGAVWFSDSAGSGRITSAGSISLFSLPNGFTAAAGPVDSNSGALWTIAYQSLSMDESFIMKTTPGGVTAPVRDFGTCCRSGFGNAVNGSDGAIWFAASNEGGPNGLLARFNPTNGTGGGLGLITNGNPNSANQVGAGADGNLWVTSNFGGPPPGRSSDSSVFVVSTASKILNQFFLPQGSFPQGIVAGSDKNMWIAERGTNKIARMSANGSFVEFEVPTPNAGVQSIVAGTDAALWFTENEAGKLGRITTDGTMTEYPLASADSKPFGIATCPVACENAHGRLWITEGAGKIAKFEF